MEKEIAVLDVLGVDNTSAISLDDYNAIEDNFNNSAVEVLTDLDKTIIELENAGMTELAGKIKDLNNASLAYDWAKENL